MKVENAIFLLFGEESRLRDQKIFELKKRFITTPEQERFDYHSFDANRLSAVDLKKALIDLPALAPQCLLVVRQAEKLSDQNKGLILAFLNAKQASVVLILDVEGALPVNNFFKTLKANSQVFSFLAPAKQDVFKVTRLIESGDAKGALLVLWELFENKEYPLKLMGGIVWFWGQQKNRLRSLEYQKGLLEIQKADMNIKRSRLKPQQALEILVVQLCCLRAS